MTITNNYPENLSAAERYHLTLSPAVQKMKDAQDSTISVKAWALYNDTDKDGKEQEILSILTNDGEIYATNSRTFIDDFRKMWELFVECGEIVHNITVVSGMSKAGREFITCVYAA